MVSLLEKLVNLNKTRNIHVFLCGLRGSGKTTLLYKSLIKDWNNIHDEIEPTILYHYEELRLNGRCYGIWDFSGDSKVKDIPTYIANQLQVTAVVFVINTMEQPGSVHQEVVDRLQRLNSDDAFKLSLFVVLFNQITSDSENRNLEEMLKTHFSDPDRFTFVTVNALQGMQDQSWLHSLDLIYRHHKKTMK
ncbi:uncharacterized protein BXIN_2096 [Babesia sp. Xinjiang]|uniref:uncharacterized protein n=1 Tax=Babesia sp. Xinjiang TaxID=462227 RepID=UPI000A222590|nr:uncharacterized protein BXIN_2096 [Babesia sp. Xinjiang]ORM40439.1 hypothetical protein BXIN_2096 [Babesia sp. Xinjiang]